MSNFKFICLYDFSKSKFLPISFIASLMKFSADFNLFSTSYSSLIFLSNVSISSLSCSMFDSWILFFISNDHSRWFSIDKRTLNPCSSNDLFFSNSSLTFNILFISYRMCLSVSSIAANSCSHFCFSGKNESIIKGALRSSEFNQSIASDSLLIWREVLLFPCKQNGHWESSFIASEIGVIISIASLYFFAYLIDELMFSNFNIIFRRDARSSFLRVSSFVYCSLKTLDWSSTVIPPSLWIFSKYILGASSIFSAEYPCNRWFPTIMWYSSNNSLSIADLFFFSSLNWVISRCFFSYSNFLSLICCLIIK